MSADVTPCSVEDHCQRFGAGHHMHQIHARHLGETPWGWRDAFVAAVDGRTISLAYVSGGTAVVWHHRKLHTVLTTGAPVRLHEQLHALGLPTGWYNVAVLAGAGPVAPPVDAEPWRPEMTWGVADARAGTGLPLDHLDP